MWDPHPPSKHASPLPPRPPSNSRPPARVTPAKRITFYKSGDSRFGGVRMAVHKRSFKCFDALLDDLSQKVPLPFGVRTVTTPRGVHAIKHLEQLQDGGCYLCSDRRRAAPVNVEPAGKRPGAWRRDSRRPRRPESSSATPPGRSSRRRRRILLVKNSEPGMRRSVALSGRAARSLRAFLDEASEAMQFHVRELYTAEGRRIDGVRSLVACPGVLLCVGREAFSPALVNFIRRRSEDKLPGLGSRSPGNGARSPAAQGARSPPRGAQSRASEHSDGPGSQKNVNFGLEAKKSIIHPRSDSSNRSARFSSSSEKSYGDGVGASSHARPAIMNDDIEKRVLVNEDGSLSVQMRVRFRLRDDQTIQWSTRVKKSPSLTHGCPLSRAEPRDLQRGQSESCSDLDSASFDPEGGDYSSQRQQRVLEGSNCCSQSLEQQYDLWENPARRLREPPAPPPHAASRTRHTHSSGSSSSRHSRRVARCRTRVSDCGGGPAQSRLVQEAMFLTERVEQDGETHVEVRGVSRRCSRSEVDRRPPSRKSVADELVTEERVASAISRSSHVLQSLNEDQDDELVPCASQCRRGNGPSPRPTSQAPRNDEQTGDVSAGPVGSEERKKGDEETGSTSPRHRGAAESHSTARAEETGRAPSSRSKTGRASCRSNEASVADDEDEDVKRVLSSLSGHTELSLQSSRVCLNCGGCQREVNSNSGASQESHLMSAKSNLSAKSDESHKSTRAPERSLSPRSGPGEVGEGRAASQRSGRSVRSPMSCETNNDIVGLPSSKETEMPEDEQHRCESVTSARSASSAKSGRTSSPAKDAAKTGDRSLSATSGKSHASVKSTKSQKWSRTTASPNPNEDDLPSAETNGQAEQDENVRVASVLSVKSRSSVGSRTSHKSSRSLRLASTNPNVTIKSPDDEEGNERKRSAASVESSTSWRNRAAQTDVETDDNVVEVNAPQSTSQGQVLSPRSAGSVSLGVPEDEDTVESSVSFQATAERKSRVKTATPHVPEKEGTGSIVSQKSSGKTTRNRPAVDIPTIETPGGSRHRGEAAGERTTGRGAGALSAQSSRSNKSSRGKAGNDLQTGSVRSGSATSDVGAPDSRPRSASAKVRSKSSASASGKKSVNVARNSGDKVTEDQAIGRPAGEADGKEETADDKSPCGLKGEASVKEHEAKCSRSVKTSSSQKKEMNSSRPRPVHSPRPGSRVEAPGQSTPSRPPSAADMLKETSAAARPHGRQSKATPKKRAKSRNQADPEALDLPPACLPDASPNEVVGDWLRRIPANSGMPALGDELQEEVAEEKPGEEKAKEEEVEEQETAEAKEGEEKDEGAACDAAEEEPSPGDAVGASSRPETRLASGAALPRNACSSAAVTEVLLSPSLGRCRSLPEASPVYGRSLSTSARGLLDRLAQLQLIEPALRPGFDLKKDPHYEDIIATLQSLWLSEPRNTEKEEAEGVGTEQVSPPRSSSGVGMSSGSGGSGKENGNPPGGKATAASLHEDGAAEEEQSPVPPSLDGPKAPDPSSSATQRQTADDSGSAPTALRAPVSKRQSQDPDPVWVLRLLKKLEKQIMSHYVSATEEFKVRWELADSVALSTMMGELRDELSRRIQSSVDREVKKIQGRAGRGGGRSPRPPQRGNLSGESTVTGNRRRRLKVMKKQSLITAECPSDDDTPGEFSDRRSDDEYCPCDACVRKKMDARPFKANPLASEAPVEMEFDLLKILQLRKDPVPATVHAQPAAGGGDSNVTDEMGRSLEVLQEEEEEEEEDQTKEDIKAHIVLEETIPEEDEELAKEEDGEEAGEKEEKSSASDEAGEEMAKNGDEEEEEEEAECHCQRDINEEGEEETAGEDAEGINDNTGEDETGEEDERVGEEGTGGEEEEEEEEQGDLETVKAADERESTEKDERRQK